MNLLRQEVINEREKWFEKATQTQEEFGHLRRNTIEVKKCKAETVKKYEHARREKTQAKRLARDLRGENEELVEQVHSLRADLERLVASV